MTDATSETPGAPGAYLDHAATTPVSARVLEAMLPYFGDAFGNPASVHRVGQRARRALEEARERVAGALGSGGERVVFTSGATEANNQAILEALSPTFEMVGHPYSSIISFMRAVLRSSTSWICAPTS